MVEHLVYAKGTLFNFLLCCSIDSTPPPQLAALRKPWYNSSHASAVTGGAPAAVCACLAIFPVILHKEHNLKTGAAGIRSGKTVDEANSIGITIHKKTEGSPLWC